MKPSQNKKKIGKKKKKPKPSSPPPPPSQSAGAESKGDEGVGGEKAGDEERKDLDWLIDAFDSASIDQIESVYREAGGDAYKAAGILGAHLDDPGEAPASSGGGGGGGRRARRKPKRVAAATGMVSDVIGKSYSSPVVSRRAEEEKRRGDAERAYSVEDAEQFLCSMLGDGLDLGMGVVRDVLGQCGCDVEKFLSGTGGVTRFSSILLQPTQGEELWEPWKELHGLFNYLPWDVQ